MFTRSRTALLAFLVLAVFLSTVAAATAAQPLTVSPIVAPGIVSEAQAFYQGGKMLYISDRSNDSVKVFSGTTLIKTISVGDYPVGVCVDEAAKKVYVASYGDKNISVINAVTNTVTGTIPLTLSPYGIAINKVTKKLYVTNFWNGSVTVVDATTGLETTTVSFSGQSQPMRVAVNSTTNQVYIYHYGSGNVVALDGSTDSTYNVVDTYIDRAVSMAVNETTNKLYVCGESGGCYAINGVTNVATQLGTYATSVGIDATNGKLYLSNGGYLNVVSAADHSVIQSNFYTDVPAEFSAWSPLEAKLYVYSSGYDKLATVQDGEPPADPSTSPAAGISVPASTGWSLALAGLLGVAVVAWTRARSSAGRAN